MAGVVSIGGTGVGVVAAATKMEVVYVSEVNG